MKMRMELNKFVGKECPVCESNAWSLFYLEDDRLEVLSEDLIDEFICHGVMPTEEIKQCLVCETIFTLGGFDE